MKNADMPAHPTKGGMAFYIPESLEENVKKSCEAVMREQYSGLTKRELIAAMAMQGLLSDIQHNDLKEILRTGRYESAGHVIAESAVNYADALLTELEKK